MLPGFGLDRRLWKSPSRSKDLVEELIVEVVAIRQHDDGWVRHPRMAHHFANVEEHLQALPAPLCVPHDTSPTISPLHRREGRVHCLVDSVKLMVLGKTLDDAAAFVREADKTPNEVQEARRLEHPSHEHLHLRRTRCS